MTRELLERLSNSWFSNHDEPFAVEVHCGACGEWAALHLAWAEFLPGSGGLKLGASIQDSPFVLIRHARFSCHCGARITLVLTGAAGGRQAEEQYGVAALQTGDQLFT
jgi:hypothetical protein